MIHCQILSTFFSSDCIGKKAIRTLIGFEISKTGKVARIQYPGRPNLVSRYILDGTTKAEDNTRLRTEDHNAAKTCDTRGIPFDGRKTQCLNIASWFPATNVRDCMTWGSLSRWRMAPPSKQSIGDLIRWKKPSKKPGKPYQNSVTCPKTGRQSTQRNNHQIFLVPTKN